MPGDRAEIHSALSQQMSRRTLMRGMAGFGVSLPFMTIMAACEEEGDDGQPVVQPGTALNLTGSGATFPDPVYQVWIDEFRSVRPDVTINYQSVGSGQGKRDFINNVTDFGSSDAFLTDEEMARVPDALHIPTVIGAVAVTYNLEGVENLQLSGETLAAIYLGDITSWNDPQIQDENPDIDLPDADIGAIFRSDGSGTTWIFTDYLSRVSEDWQERVGTGTSVQWPVGFGGEKNAGVMASVQQTPGSVGYVELIYTLLIDQPAVSIRNRQGNFVQPTLDAVQAAAAGFLDELPDDMRISITDPPEGDDSYPISGFTWMLLRQEQEDRQKGQALVEFIHWALTEGDQFALDLHYSPLPDEVRERALDMLASVHFDGEQLLDAPDDSD